MDNRKQFADVRIGSNPAWASVVAGGRLFVACVVEVVEDYGGCLG